MTQVVTTDLFAGTERYVVNVARELASRGHDVAVVGGNPAAMPLALGVGLPWRPGANTSQTVRSLLAGGRRDIVHSHMTKADFCAAAVSPVVGGRRLSTRHITAPRGFSPLARRLAPAVRRSLARELAVSGFVSRSLEVPADEVLLNGVYEIPTSKEPRARTVLVAHRLAPEKDTPTALRAFALSGLASRGWRLRIAGAGEDRAALEGLAEKLAITDHTDWLGWVDDSARLFRLEGILLAPAPSEPCGLSILEAMAAGMPVVASGSGGNVETIGQLPTAALFSPGDAAAAAGQLVGLADDDLARAAYGDELRRLQRKRFTLEGHVDRLEALYRRVLAGTAAGSASA